MRQKNDPPTQPGRPARDHGRNRWLATLHSRLRRLAGCLGPGMARQRRASIAVVGAAVISMLASLAAVAVDLGTGYLAKVSNQRTADSAAYAGALAATTPTVPPRR